MSLVAGIRAIVENAGIFAVPLVALAFATFAVAAWAGLRLREIETTAYADHAATEREVRRALRLLGAAAALAPLVGLLGTVHGLIVLFAGLADAGVFDGDVLSTGVGQALFTTEFGLAIAVPAIVLHAAILRLLRARTGATDVSRARRRRRASR